MQNAKFSARLMMHPDLVARCVMEMSGAVSVPVTVKTRIGVDERDSYEDLYRFVSIVADARKLAAMQHFPLRCTAIHPQLAIQRS